MTDNIVKLRTQDEIDNEAFHESMEDFMTKVLESDDQITSFSFVVVAKNNVFVRSITGDNPLELIGAVEYAKTHMMVEMHDG